MSETETLARRCGMSAPPQSTDVNRQARLVRFVPILLQKSVAAD